MHHGCDAGAARLARGGARAGPARTRRREGLVGRGEGRCSRFPGLPEGAGAGSPGSGGGRREEGDGSGFAPCGGARGGGSQTAGKGTRGADGAGGGLGPGSRPWPTGKAVGLVVVSPGWGRGPAPGLGLPLGSGAPGRLPAACGSPELQRDLGGGGRAATNTNFIYPRGVGGRAGCCVARVDHLVLRRPLPPPVPDCLVGGRS